MAIRNYIDRLVSAGDAGTIQDVGVELAHSLGCDYFLYAGIGQFPISVPQVTLIGNYPLEWIQRYQEMEYARVDPTVIHATQRVTPLFWCDLDLADATQAAFFEDARSHGIVSGVTIPLHSASGYTALLTFVSSSDDQSIYKTLRSALSDLLLFGYRLHDIVMRSLDVERMPKEREPLSEVERKCLMWAAEGKTTWEIGTILSIKERTVTYHLNSATKKLAAVNRQHAIACAVALGEIRANLVTLPDKIVF